MKLRHRSGITFEVLTVGVEYDRSKNELVSGQWIWEAHRDDQKTILVCAPYGDSKAEDLLLVIKRVPSGFIHAIPLSTIFTPVEHYGMPYILDLGET